MIKVGLTGGIGSGKSTVARIFALLGIPVYDCDRRARTISDTDPRVRTGVVEAFGPETYREGRMDRKYVGSLVFGNPDRLTRLNSIIHPILAEDYIAWASSHNNFPYTVMESAILLESGFDRMVDRIVCVSAPEEIRISRVMSRDGLDRESVSARISSQMDEVSREERADWVLDASGETLLVPQVLDLHGHLIELSR